MVIKMKKYTIYRLEKFKFHYYDEKDDENVEDRFVLGYFCPYEELVKAIEVCKKYDIKEDELAVHEFPLELSKNQKYIYELSYGYSILDSNSRYIDYDYVFTPQRNRKCCLELKADLQQDRKYQCSKEKIFDKETPDGFWIEKLQINKLYNVITVDNQEKSL